VNIASDAIRSPISPVDSYTSIWVVQSLCFVYARVNVLHSFCLQIVYNGSGVRGDFLEHMSDFDVFGILNLLHCGAYDSNHSRMCREL
jgi:hypothetical protein